MSNANNPRRRACLFLALFLILWGLVPLCAAQEEKLVGKTVNINKATVEELATVPLITPDLAKNMVAYREENGDFQTLEEILQVKGFNRDLLNRIKPFLLLEGLGGDACTC